MPNDCRRLLLHRTLAVHSQYTGVPSLSFPTLFRSNFANDPVFQVPLAILIFWLFASFFAEPRSESLERATQKFSLSLQDPNIMTTKRSYPLNCAVLKLASSSKTSRRTRITRQSSRELWTPVFGIQRNLRLLNFFDSHDRRTVTGSSTSNARR